MTGSALGPSLLHQDLSRYRQFWEAKEACWDQREAFEKFWTFISSVPDCCSRQQTSGHCTGSALITDLERKWVLLLFHPFLQRWLQPGGHADGDPDLLRVAHREAWEETGLPKEALFPAPLGNLSKRPVPLDLDIHPIPARGSELAHEHFDLRFWLVSDPGLTLNPESPDLKLAWVPLNRVRDYTEEESVLRLVRKVGALSFNPL